jgi:DNA-binding NtrC family response regulator
MTSADNSSILVVDDEADNRLNLADILSDLGYRVDTAADGPSALELLRQQRYDVALLDLLMPGMDGAALYGELKKVRPETVALIVTAYPNHPRAEAALAAGAWKLLSKPVDFPRLLALVEEAVGQPLVLVVDDDPDLCANLWDLLREHGYRVCLAHDVRTATEQLSTDQAIKVILLDMKLPDGDGSQVFRQARQVAPQAQVVVITAHQAEVGQPVPDLLAEGAQAVLRKPFDLPRLLDTLNRLAAKTEAGN